MKRFLSNPLRTFIAGALALLPLAATVLIIVWSYQLLSHYIGPGSRFGQLLSSLGLGATESELVSYLLGLMAIIVVIYVFGLLVETGLQRGLARFINGLMLRIPVVRTVYDVIQKLVALFGQKGEGDQLKSMSAVWLYFGGRDKPSTVVLALLSTPEPVMVHGVPLMGVLIPTAPVPIGGGLLYVPADWVVPAEMGIEAVTSIYVSMGVTSEQYLKKKS
jgi:uncharacterized membrane protein